MSENVILAVIAGLPSTIAALGALYVSIVNGRKVDEVHRATNSMKDELVAVTSKEQRALGRLEGASEARLNP
jgi:hypothetical protein